VGGIAFGGRNQRHGLGFLGGSFANEGAKVWRDRKNWSVKPKFQGGTTGDYERKNWTVKREGGGRGGAQIFKFWSVFGAVFRARRPLVVMKKK
jgi:hypothetical protein